jgi:hypothetical protein
MPLIIVKTSDVASLPLLYRLVLRFIYERHAMRIEDIHLMMHSMIAWPKKSDITEEELFLVQSYATMLKRDEEGKLDRRKRLFKEHGIDWKKFHKLPEVKREPKFFKDPYLN